MTATIQRGCFAMPVTPWTGDGKHLDTDTYFSLIQRAVEGGIRQFICIAASGEAFETSPAEGILAVKTAIAAAAGRATIFGSVPWSTPESVTAAAAMMELGAAGVMELPMSWAYASQPGAYQRIGRIAEVVDGKVIAYQRLDLPPDDTTCVRLASEGKLIAVKRAAPSVPFAATLEAIRRANPSVLVVQGAAERFVAEVLFCNGDQMADGFTSGLAFPFPRVTSALESAFLQRDHERLGRLLALGWPIENMRAEYRTGYNIAPIKGCFELLGFGDLGQTRARYPYLIEGDLERLREIATPIMAEEESMW